MEQLACSVNEAAQALGVCRATIYNWMKDGRIETRRVGGRRLVKIASVRRLVEESSEPRCDDVIRELDARTSRRFESVHSRLLRNDRMQRISEMRKKGMTFRQIGQALGMNGHYLGAEWNHYKRRLRRVMDEMDQAGDEIPLSTCDIPMRLHNAFRCEGFDTVEQAAALSDAELLRIPNVGVGSVRAWREYLQSIGITGDPPSTD